MSNQNYSLEIVSHHPTFKNKNLRKYYVDGIETVGAWGDEPFEIRFTNRTWKPVEVKISLDGTDVLTGDKADTESTNGMFYVKAYGNLALKAWPETANGGAQFVFTSAEKSVAVHTHGDMSSRGIIAVAVYTEGHVDPVWTQTPLIVKEEHHHHYPRSRKSSTAADDYFYGSTYSSNDVKIRNCSESSSKSSSNISENSLGFTDSEVPAWGPAAASGSTMDYLNVDLERSIETKNTKSLENLVSVGAGQHVDQKLSYVSGLKKPLFAETVRVRYLWWDDLVAKLRENNVPAAHASGFPGDRKHRIMSLGKTPRIGNFGKAFPRENPAPLPVQSYMRV